MKKTVKIIGILLISVFMLWFLLFLFPLSSKSSHAFFEDKEGPLVIAHRGGKAIAPENTLAAFRNAAELDVDILEYDVHITADGHLVVIHDDTVDRTTNGSGRVNEMTLEEIKALDAGYQFKDAKGDFVFRNSGVKIPTVQEVFSEFNDKKHLIEIKDSNDPVMYGDLIDEMWNEIQKFDMKDKVLIASFDHDINLRFQDVSNGEVAIGAGEEETRQFVTMHKAFLNALYRPKAAAFQLPTEQEGFNLADWKLIRGANSRGMHVYYWTINEEDMMEKLIDLGADGIMTDNPRLLLDVLSNN
ncbi:glycerophosphodiester phosphodiesterase [Alkalibacterium sp. 20]|uniref:glycerophosphodiester phosphodiesterase n=1 Tax=Alkalibacterium sp. 20 TaxID=1798803 RepID=UPI0009001EC9|nr:glycerophosphodiester phosphodiesterase [Alkalibacterium sp. 20]OJF94150.1 glycerophosphodiester phosphodiesterase [Alkalibacterium sp. 20]